MEKHPNYILIHQLLLGGFSNAESMTEECRDLIAQPSDAPENFFHDGEVGIEEAVEIWTNSLKKAGLTREQIAKAYKFNNIVPRINYVKKYRKI